MDIGPFYHRLGKIAWDLPISAGFTLFESDVHNVILRANYDWRHDSEKGALCHRLGSFISLGWVARI